MCVYCCTVINFLMSKTYNSAPRGEIMKARTIWVIVLMGLSLWWSSLITPPVITSKTAYFPTLDKGHRQSPLTPHDPIQILSDAYWSSQGWPGAGTTENPYRIENLIINPPTWTHAIEINNTRCHVLIQNC